MVGPLHSRTQQLLLPAQDLHKFEPVRVQHRGREGSRGPIPTDELLKAFWGRRVGFVLESRWMIPEED